MQGVEKTTALGVRVCLVAHSPGKGALASRPEAEGKSQAGLYRLVLPVKWKPLK